jgi:nicotinamidase-related amidase
MTDGPFKPALLVIDMQNDFVTGSLAVPDAEAVIPIVNDLLGLPFVVKIASKDWHPADHISFAERHGKDAFTNITVSSPIDSDEERSQELWPVHCVQDTFGAEFVAGFNQAAIDEVVLKGEDPEIDSYSAVQDVWRIQKTPLSSILKGRGITDVFVCGIAGDFCVKHTALDTADFKFNTWVIKDACRSVFDGGKEWEEMAAKGIRITDLAQVRARIREQTMI